MEQALLGLVHRNLMDVNVLGAEGSGGTVHARNGELFFASRSTAPFLNGVMRESPDGDAAELLDRARSFFFERECGFVVFAWPGDPELEQAALSAGMFPVLERYPEMVCRSPLQDLPDDVRAVGGVEDAAAYWRICDQAYPSIGFPPDLFTETFQPQLLLDPERVWACIAHQDGQPVACASLWLTSGAGSDVGFIGWVAALPEARGHGLAAACTVRATNRAFELGASVASLQASPMGEHIYRNLGYEELFAYRLIGAMPPD
jgi:GNAT superfamily N-acetyltransferase